MSPVAKYVQDYQARVLAGDRTSLLDLLGVYSDATERLLQQGRALRQEYDQLLREGYSPDRYLVGRLDRSGQFAAYLAAEQAEVGRRIAHTYDSAAQRLAQDYATLIENLVTAAAPARGFERVIRAWSRDLVVATEAAASASTGGVGWARFSRAITQRYIISARDALTQGLLAGEDTRSIGRDVRDAAGVAVTESARWVRTESHRALRHAAQAVDGRAGVSRWRRTAAKQVRTCIACLLADGDVYETDRSHDFHVSCRCVLIPLLPETLSDGTALNPAPLGLETGRDWFARQPEATKATILGSLYKPYKRGDIRLEDTVHQSTSATWGPARKTATLGQARASAAVRAWLPGTGRATVHDRLVAAKEGLRRVLRAEGLDESTIQRAVEQQLINGRFPLDVPLTPTNSAAAAVYIAAAETYTEPRAAIARGKAWLKARVPGLDPDRATPPEVARALRMHLPELRAPKITFTPGAGSVQAVRQRVVHATRTWDDDIRDALPLGSRLAHEALDSVPVHVASRARASADGTGIFISTTTGASTVAHELMHVLEDRVIELRIRSARWVLDAAKENGVTKPARLKTLSPRVGYGAHEVTFVLPGVDPYTTKVYTRGVASRDDPKAWYGTEVLSQWAQRYVEDKHPASWGSKAEQDWWWLGLAAMVGE